jgi:diguanylate cyclase (GGDEF)-like protein
MPQQRPVPEVQTMLEDAPTRLDDPRLDELERLQRRHAELELLYDTIRDLTSTLSVREVLDRLMGRALDHLDAEIGSILLMRPDDRMRIVTARGLPADVVEETAVGIGEGISGYVARTGRSLLVTDVESDERFRRRNHERYYTASFISAPLVHMGSVRGVVNVNNKRSRDDFYAEDLALLEALAGHASAALSNAHRYEAVLERAQRDSLTGLSNHGHMWSVLKVEAERADRHGRPLSLVMLDIDHFKAFNDRFGHRAGDEALCVVARVLEANSRSHDVVARYGGEEFAVILPETDVEGSLRYADKMRRAVEAARFEPAACQRLSISAGVSTTGASARTPQELVEQADARLYRAKRAGRNCVCGPEA